MKYYNQAPYYDDYNDDSDYVQVLAVAGNYSQSREITQIGSIFRNHMARFGNAIFKNGQIISGCDLVINGSVATVTEGLVYLEGMVRKIKLPLTVAITGIGTEVIGLAIHEEVISPLEDPSLRNPAIGTEAYNTEGSNRVKQTVIISVNNPNATSIYKLQDGLLHSDVVQTNENTQDVITDVLAKRTFDESGNFKIEGLEIIDKESENDENAEVYITAGRAYIKGYEVIKPNMEAVPYKTPTTLRDVYNEPKTFLSGTWEYYLNNTPLHKVKHITTDVRITREITRGSVQGGRDELPDKPVKNIEQISYNGTTYVQGTDYQLTGNYVDWSLMDGVEPNPGVTYEVTYVYKRENVENLDYVVIGTGDSAHIQFLSTGNIPVPNTEILIDYDFYLARKDTFCLDRYGEYSIIYGIPEKADYCEPPINSDPSLLELGTVLTYANSTRKVIMNEYTTRLTQRDIYNLKRRIDDMEYNQAITDLDREAQDGEPATDLKGILTDGFIGFTKCDLGHPEFDCSIDIDMGEMTLPFDADVISLNIDNDSADTNIGEIGRVVSAPYRLDVCKSQPLATKRFLVNPYAVFGKLTIIKLNPEVDNWIENEVITINETKTQSVTLRRWWYHRGESWAAAEEAKYRALGFANSASLGWGSGVAETTSVSQSIKNEAIAYMRSRTVQITAQNFQPYEDNIEVFFNGKKVEIKNQSSAGSATNSVRANNKGRFTCEFTVPPNVPCGSAKVELVGPISNGNAIYKAEGTKRTTTKKVLTTRTVVNPYDPLAQSFQFDRDTVVMAIDVAFASKDPERACTLQVRNMVNGYPGTTLYAEEVLRPEDIIVNGDRPVATTVNLTQPVYCEADTQYCFVVLSDSNIVQVWVAEMGETDVVTGELVSSQPSIDGVMFSSSNGLTWTAHQTADLWFNLYKATYTGEGSVVFKNVSSIDFNRILIAAETEDHKNAGIEWWYRVNGSTAWNTIETYVDRETSEIGKTFDLKAIIKVAQSTSPFIANDCMNLVYFKERDKGVYVSREVVLEENYTNLKISCEFALPAGCTQRVYYMCPDRSSEWVLCTSPQTAQITQEFTRYTYEVTGLNAKKFRVKVELDTVNPLARPRARKLMSIMKY